jgi:hypothetical protein
MVLPFATVFPASASNLSRSRSLRSLATAASPNSSPHFTLPFHLFICTICDGDALNHPVFPLFFVFFFPFPSTFLFLSSFGIPTEWNPLRRGGGCNRLTICYYSTCSSTLPCIFFPNAIVYSVSLPFPHCRGSWLFVSAAGFEPGFSLVLPSLFDRIKPSRSILSHRSCSSTHSLKRASRALLQWFRVEFDHPISRSRRSHTLARRRSPPRDSPSPRFTPLRSPCRILNRLPPAHPNCRQHPRHRLPPRWT